jgi:catecholate siderophore receptor
MGQAIAPRSLRSLATINRIEADFDGYSGRKVSAVAGLIVVASVGGAEAQQPTNLPPVNVDAPTARPRPAASRPTPDQVRARDALRRAARRAQPQQAAPVPFPGAGGLRADRDPYADPAAPYKGDRLQASGKFPEPILNTPRSVTVLTREVLQDKNATSLKQAILSTAGVTLGTGEGGNAFGDRFFIRGFDVRNDIFIDGVRDPGVSVRENFFTEQVEILRGPASSFAGRGTAGGAINIVTKQATTAGSFYNADTTFGTDSTKRVTLDVNQVISPTLAIRAGGLFQDANVAGRNYVTDDRNGGFVAATWKPVDAVKITGNYIHTELTGIPDFGVPYYRPSTATTAGGPFPEFGVDRHNFYGFVNRDFFRTGQDIGTLNAELQITPDLVVTNRFRDSSSSQMYVGTLPESPVLLTPLSASTLSANPQSRFQVTNVIANQTEATYKFNDGLGFRHTALAGVEVDRETSSINSFSGLASEITTGPAAFTGSSLKTVSVFAPQFANLPFGPLALGVHPTNIGIDTASGYLLDSANYHDLLIFNAGVRYDDYKISTAGWGSGTNANVFATQSAEFGIPDFNLGLTLKPLPNGSVYVAYATSANPVGAEFDGTSTAYGGINPVLPGGNTQIFGPEKNKAIEIGTKWELFNRHLLLTAALFQTTKENAREAQNVNSAPAATALGCTYPTGTTGNISCITAGASYYVRGIDLGIGGKITDRWSVFGGLVLMQSAVTRSNAPPADPALYTTNVGLPLANIAHQSFSMLTKYQLNDTWELGGQAVYRSKIYGGTLLAANQGTSIPSYWRFDAFAEAKIDKNWKVKLFVNNIFNKLYYDALYQSAAPFVLEAPGRAVYLVLSARY